MRHNYESIGGRSPLTELTFAQADALRGRLGWPVAVGMRTWRPFIKDAFAELTASGVDLVIGIPLAPQFSTLSVKKYTDAAEAAVPAGVQFTACRSFATHPLLIEAFAERLREAAPKPDEDVVFTAHSLPVRAIESGDPYADEVNATAREVSARAGIETYGVAYQSAGRTPEPWIGPEINDTVRERAARGCRRVLIVPIGFVCDHTEILFDIDVQAAATAQELGVALRRTRSLNDSPIFIRLLEDIARGLAAD
jgi:ferrochelatase